MHIRSLKVCAFLIGIGIGLPQCEKEESQLEKSCTSVCRGGFACRDANIPHCIDQCVERQDEASEIGDSCSKSYIELIECLSPIQHCDLFGDWEDLRGFDAEYPCRLETEVFLKVCPDLWFEDPLP